jgi:YD repeat-containing protein
LRFIPSASPRSCIIAGHDLLRRLDDQPFKPFRIRMVNNTVFDVLDAGMVIVGQTSAVIVTQYDRDEQGRRVAADWRTISIGHIIEFADIDDKEIRRRKRA